MYVLVKASTFSLAACNILGVLGTMCHSWTVCHMAVYSKCDNRVFESALCTETWEWKKRRLEQKKQRNRVALKTALLPTSWGRNFPNHK